MLAFTLVLANSPFRMFFSKNLARTMEESHTVAHRLSAQGKAVALLVCRLLRRQRTCCAEVQ